MRDDEIQVLGTRPGTHFRQAGEKLSRRINHYEGFFRDDADCAVKLCEEEMSDFEWPSITFMRIKKPKNNRRFIWMAIIIAFISGLLLIPFIYLYLPQSRHIEQIENLIIRKDEKIVELQSQNTLLREKIKSLWVIQEAVNRGCPRCHSHEVSIIADESLNDILNTHGMTRQPMVSAPVNYLRCRRCGNEYGALNNNYSE